jgi:hypothetical protein
MADRAPVEVQSAPLHTVAADSSALQPGSPILAEEIDQRYHLLNVYAEEHSFEPWLAATASVRFYNGSRNIDEVKQVKLRLYLDESFDEPDWQSAEPLEADLDSCGDSPPAGSRFYALPQKISALKNFRSLEKDLSNYLYHNQRLYLQRAPSLKMESKPGETEADFRVRIADHQRERKEVAVEKQAAKFQLKRERLEKKLVSAYARLEKEKGDVSAKTTDTILSFGTAVLGAFMGRKKLSSTTMTRTASGIRKAGRIGKEKDDVRRAEEQAAGLELELVELEAEQNRQLEALAESFDPALVETETFAIKPRRSDIFDLEVCLLWEMVV